MGNEQIGLDAIWNNANFLKGQAEYVNAINQAEGKSTGFSSTLSGGVGGMLQFGAAIGVGVTAVQAIATALISGMFAMKQFGEDALMAASHVQQLNYIAQILGQKAGYTSEEINGLVDSIRAQGISMAVANDLVAQFLKGNLDLAQASALAKVAQDSATLANMGSSEALEKLIYGIQTLQPEVLRTAGITISLEQAYKEYAKTMGKTAAELTQVEKKQIALNAVLAEGEKIAGAYDASMKTAGKQLGSLQSRLIPDLLATMGAPFQSAFYNAVTAINKLVSGFTAMFSEGGRLYPILVNLGAIASIVTEGFLNLATTVVDVATGVGTAAQDGFMGAINSAFQWGYNLVAQFAQGMLNAASTAIVSAINWISNLLTGWFAPGSPPMILPEIDTWGTATIGEWLKGFTKGDFSILDTIEGQIKNALGAMVDLGQIGQGQANDLLKGLSEELIRGLAEGNVSEEFFAQLTASLGEFGAEIATLTREQLALADAEAQVTQAEKDLEDARKRSSDAGKEVNQLTMDYNRMLRGGASAQELAAQKEKIDLAKKAQDQANKDEQAAQERLDAAQEQRDILKEQVELQAKLVQELIELAKLSKEIEQPGGGEGGAGGGAGGAGGAGGGLELPELPTGDIGGITDKMKEAIEEAKAKILASLKDMWDKVVAMWDTGVKALGEWWNKLVQWAHDTWNKIAKEFGLPSWEEIQAAWGKATKWIAKQVDWLVKLLQKWWKDHGESVAGTIAGMWNFIKTVFNTAVKIISGVIQTFLNGIKGFWKRNGEKIMTFLVLWWNNLKTAFANWMDGVGKVFDFWAAIFRGDWGAAWQALVDGALLVWANIQLGLSTIWEGIKLIFSIAVTELGNIISTIWEAIKKWTKKAWDAISKKLSEVWEGITKTISEAVETVRKWIEEKILAIQTKWNEIWDAVSTKATEIWTSIITFIKTTIENIQKKIKDTIDAIKTKWDEIWNGIKTKIDEVWTSIVTWITTQIDSAKTYIETQITAIQTKWNEIWDSVSTKVTEIWTAIYTTVSTKIDEAKKYLETQIDTLKTNLGTTWDAISTKVSEIWGGIVTAVTTYLTGPDGLVTKVTGTIDGLLTTLGGYVQSFYDWGADLIGGAVDGVLSAVGDLIDAVTQAIYDAVNAAREALGLPPITGGDPTQGVGDVIDDVTGGGGGGGGGGGRGGGVADWMGGGGSSFPSLPTARVPITTGSVTNNYVNIQMNNQLSGGIGLAQLEFIVDRSVRKALKIA